MLNINGCRIIEKGTPGCITGMNKSHGGQPVGIGGESLRETGMPPVLGKELIGRVDQHPCQGDAVIIKGGIKYGQEGEITPRTGSYSNG
jgi:hypothetical protein